MAANRIVPNMKGKNAKMVFFQNNQKKNIDIKTFNVKPNVTKHADGVCGEQRDRLSVTLNHYEGSMQVYMTDATALQAYLDNQKQIDALAAPMDQQAAVRFLKNDGATKFSFTLVDMILDDFDLNVGGKSENVMITLNFRCGDMKEVGTV